MARTGSIFGIRYEHMGWEEDAMTILFAQAKNDQAAERLPREPRHVYANPCVPEVCTILSLAMYFSCYAFNRNHQLFHGSAQCYR